MTTEEFWKHYTGTKDILKIFDITYDFFSNELPPEFIEDYDVGEVILETRGHNETAKEFEKVIKFTELLKTKHPVLYNEYFQYFDDFLVDFYCFHKNNVEVENAFSNFAGNPVKDFDNFLVTFKKLLFYQYFDILDTTIIKIYDTVKNSSKLIGGATFDLAMCKFYINLENYCNKTEISSIVNREEFAKALIPYEFNLQGEAQSAFDNGLFVNVFPKETIIDNFIQNRNNFILTLQGWFLKEMKNKNFHFALSGRLWDKMLNFWEDQTKKKKQKPDEYFSIQTEHFEKYTLELSSDFFIDNKSEMIAVLWGSVYIYDFLLSIDLINQSTYDSFKETTKILKGKVIGQITSDLWNSDFVHHWSKPESISELEFREEEKIFRKSITLKPHKFSRIRSEISDELKNIGELSEYIIKGSKIDNSKSNSLFDDLFGSIEDTKQAKKKSKDEYIDDDYTKYEPITNEKKIGRNDPCTCGSGKKFKKCCDNK
jgi:hypothetical protein